MINLPMMAVKVLAWTGDKRAIRMDAAIKVAECFKSVRWVSHSFTFNDGPRVASGGETEFYSRKEIDAAIVRLNKVLEELRA